MHRLSLMFKRLPCTRYVSTSITCSSRKKPAVGSRSLPEDGLSLPNFVPSRLEDIKAATPEQVYPLNCVDDETEDRTDEKTFHLETFGCAMNVSDSEIVHSILEQQGYRRTDDVYKADICLVNTCSIREKAEQRVRNRLEMVRGIHRNRHRRNAPKRLIGVLGCMAERLKHSLLDDGLADIVAGPDAYRDLPRLIKAAGQGTPAVNVLLSVDETYGEITPLRLNQNNTSAYVSIMRGCNQMCSYCIVPFTRGRERSRAVASILDEIQRLSDQGFKEVILLGQTVNSYCDSSSVPLEKYADYSMARPVLAQGFAQKSKQVRTSQNVRFVDLLDRVSSIDPEMRIRFTSPHPKDFPTVVLELIKERPNICKHLHLPAQSGSTRMLQRMKRDYTREAYDALIEETRRILPNVSLSTDMISGFCGETEQDHLDSIDLMSKVAYDQAFMFAYSLREKTHAHRNYQDDVEEAVKLRRLQEIIDTFGKVSQTRIQALIGTYQLVLVEGPSRRSADEWQGRTEGNRRVIFPNQLIPCSFNSLSRVPIQPGQYIMVRIESGTIQSLRATPISRSSILQFTQDIKPLGKLSVEGHCLGSH